ncbi:hypothetical protein PAXRUDRAFT_822426, partial [Paxillus rubicundulus Ve08.2h10]
MSESPTLSHPMPFTPAVVLDWHSYMCWCDSPRLAPPMMGLSLIIHPPIEISET